MKKFALVKLAVGLLVCHGAVPQLARADDLPLQSDSNRLGYAFGMNFGGNLKKQNIAVDPMFVGKGMKAGFAGEAGLLTTDQMQSLFKALEASPTNVTVDEKNFKNVKEEVGYAVGFNYAERLKGAGLEGADFNFDILAKAIQDTMDDKPPQLSTNDVTTLLKGLQTKITARREAKGAEDAKAGTEFLAKNKSAAGVVTLTNGLQYKILKAGSGPMPKLTDTVSVNYRGTLVNGEEFDASKPGNPISFPLNGVIPGWTQILQLMPTGSKWQVYIPSDLAYGARGAGAKIGPNATLIFDIELLAIK